MNNDLRARASGAGFADSKRCFWPGCLRVGRELVRTPEQAFSIEIDIQVRPVHGKWGNDVMRTFGRGGAQQGWIKGKRDAYAPPVVKIESQSGIVDLNSMDFGIVHSTPLLWHLKAGADGEADVRSQSSSVRILTTLRERLL